MLPIVMLLGPTSVGKTAVACALVDHFGGPERVQLVSVDSAMVYTGLDIGTAKPTTAELATYPHELIDIRDPADPYSAADFVADADAVIKAARNADKLIILVGGTMLYARAFLHGLADLPKADEALRKKLQEEYLQQGSEHLHTELASVDPVAAANIEPQNQQRLLRALEVVRLTGKPISKLWQEQPDVSAGQRLGRDIVSLSLEVLDRQWLHHNIEQRFELMLKKDFLGEVAALKSRADLHRDLPAMRAVGYRQAWLHLAGEISHQQFREDSLTATRRLAKRQTTWLRQWPDLVRFSRTPTDNALSDIVGYLENSPPWLNS